MNDTISREAVADAINGIECTRHTTWYEFYQKVMTAVEKLPPAELGADCISRQAAINAIDECYCGGEDSCGEPWIYKENAVEAIQMIEPILPEEPKTGKWVEDKSTGYLVCDQCRDVYINPEWLADGHWNFCPNCGADMRGERGLKI